MEKRLLLLLSLVLLHFYIVKSQFLEAIGDLNRQEGKSVQATSLSIKGSIVAGYTYPGANGNIDGHLIQSDVSGNIVWTQNYGGSLYDYLNSVREIASENINLRYIAAGYTNSFGFGNYDMWLLGTDPKGNPLFSGTYGGAADDHAYCVQRIKDQFGKPGYVLVGDTRSFTAYPGSNVYVVRTDDAGNSLDQVVIGTYGDESGYWIEQTRDGGYVIAGYTTATCGSETSTNKNLYIVKLDPNLNVVWSRIFGGVTGGSEVAYCIRENLYNNTLIVTGYTESYGSGGEAFLLNLTAAGNPLWFDTYGSAGLESGQNVLVTKDPAGAPQYIVSGYSSSFNSTANYDALTFKTNLSGNLLWTMTYGGPSTDYAYEIAHDLSAGPGYLFTGTTLSFGAGSSDVLLADVDNNGKTSTICIRWVPMDYKSYGLCISSNAQNVHLNPYLTQQLPPKYVQYKVNYCNIPARMGASTPDDMSAAAALQVSPVPASSVLNIQFNETCNGGTLNVYDAKGNIVKRVALGADTYDLPVSDLVQGMYILQVIKTDGTTENARFIKE